MSLVPRSPVSWDYNAHQKKRVRWYGRSDAAYGHKATMAYFGDNRSYSVHLMGANGLQSLDLPD